MNKEFYHDIDMNANQLFNSRLHNISTAARVILGSSLGTNDKGYQVYDIDLLTPYFWNGTSWQSAGGGGTTWGSITGTITAQTDLTTYLAANYYPLSSNPANYIDLTNLSAGTGISYNNLTGVITNSAPDQTVAFTNGTGISVTGTYPNFTITNTGTTYIPTLQEVTDAGSTTTNTITASVFVAPVFNINSATYASVLRSDYIVSTNRFHQLPNNDGTLALSVNGNTADSAGAITIPVGTGTVTAVTATSPLSSTGGTTPDISIQQASGSQAGYLSSTDWTTFNSKQDAITLTTTGTSGAATFIANTLNIPQYQSVLTNPVTGTGTATRVAFWDTSSSISSDSALYWDNTSKYLGIGTATPTKALDVTSDALINGALLGIGPNSGSSFPNTNIVFGTNALAANTTGYYNAAIGTNAMNANTTGYYNLAIGYDALKVNLISRTNIAIGAASLGKFIGDGTVNGGNTGIGALTLRDNVTGLYNTAIGYGSILSITGSSFNNAIGYSALRYATSGNYNTAIGTYAGSYYGAPGTTTLTTVNNGTFVGYYTRSLNNSSTNEIVIGYNAVGNGNNSTTIGNSGTTSTNLFGALGFGSTPSYGTAGQVLTSSGTGSAPTWTTPSTGTITSVTATAPLTSSGGTTPDISTSMNTNKLIGRSTAGVGVMEEITVGTGLSLSGGTLSSSVTGGILHGIASGTDTYAVTISGVTSYADGDAYLIRFTNGNTTSCTLDINGIGPIPLYRNNDGALIGGDIIASAEMLCVYNSTLTAFQTIGTAPNTLLGYVTNDDSVTITKGQVVYAFGGQGDRMTVKLANNTSDATSARTVGVVLSTSIAANQKGLIMMQGLLDGLSILPTATWNDGDPVYLGATAGSITPTKPYAPNHLVYVGTVTTASNGSAGRMYVNIQNGYELDELHNVQAQSPSLNDTLYYDSGVTPGQWKTASIPTILGYTPVGGSGTTGAIIKFTGATTIGDATADTDYMQQFDIITAFGLMGSSIKGTNLVIPNPGQLTNNALTLSSQSLFFTAYFIPKSMTLTGVKWFQGTNGNYTASNYNGVALYQQQSAGTLTLVASSTNDGTIWQPGSTGWKSKAFSSTYTAARGIYYVAGLYSASAATTIPALGGGTTSASAWAAYSPIDFSNSEKIYGALSGQTTTPATVGLGTISNGNSNRFGLYLY